MQGLQKRHKARIGEILLEYGFIEQDQLSRALGRQMQTGRRLGSILGEMGYIDDAMLLGILGKQYGLPYVNLSEVMIQPDVLNLIPFDKVRSLRVLPFMRTDDTVSLAMVDPHDSDTVNAIASVVGGTVRPFIASLRQMDRAIGLLQEEGYGSTAFIGGRIGEAVTPSAAIVPGIHTFLRLIPDFRATDLYLSAGTQPSLRVNGEIRRLSTSRITAGQMKDFVYEILGREQMEKFEQERELAFVLSVPDSGRFSINLFRQRNSISLSARLIFEDIPSPDQLGLPAWITDYALQTRGLILITGLPGNGKSATVASLVDTININRRCNVVTLEDPIKYLHKHKLSNVNQREIGIDTGTYAEGMKYVLRQGADVIVIGELRDLESISIAMNAAETGHLVIGAMTSMSTVTALEKVLGIFPAEYQPQARMQLAEVLNLVLGQKLIPGKGMNGRALACEKLAGSVRVRGLIRDGRTANIKALMQVASEDMMSVDRSIARLCLEGRITFEDGLKFSDSPSYYQDLIRTGAA